MRANTNIVLKNRLQMTLSDFKGVDFSSCPSKVQKNRASDMVNFINEYGVNRKRNGWKEIIRICDADGVPQRINGIFKFDDGELGQLIVHAGTRIYRIKGMDMHFHSVAPYRAVDITETSTYEDSKVIPERIKDQRSQAYHKNGKLYIIGCGDFLVYNGVELRRVENDEDTYIPTTTINIDPDSVTSDTVRVVLEDVNLLNKKRINTLVGNTNGMTWTLDTSIDEGTKVVVEIECIDDTVILSNSDPDNPSKLYREGWDNREFGSIDFAKGKITLSGDTTPPASNDSNIKVTFEHAVDGYADRINNCGFGVLFGVDGNPDRLFVSGNDEFPNIDFHSEMDDFTYFSDQSSCAMGSDDSAVKGYARLSDSTLLIYKEDSGHDATVFYRSGKYLNGYDNNGNINSMTAVFPTSAGSIGEGVISSYACANLSGDNLMLSKNGVFGVVLSNNVATNERYVRERSRNINARLTKHTDMSNAVAIAYKDRYYLSVDGVCYVADARHKTSRSDDIDGSFNYEWWFWDNIPARVWADIDDHLCFGTADGMICVFDDEYTDRVYEVGSLSFDGDRMSFSGSIDISENDTIILSAYEDTRYFIYAENFDVKDGKIFFENIEKINNGAVVFADTVGVSGLLLNEEYIVCNVDKGKRCFELKRSSDSTVIKVNSAGFRLVCKVSPDTTVYITDVLDRSFQIKVTRCGEPIVLTHYNGYESPIGEVLITHRKNVVAKWYTPAFDLGTNMSAKTLLKLGISTEPKLNGRLSFGYETRSVNNLINSKGLDVFSFDNLSFEDFAFDTAFATSYSVKVKVRNFNYIVFRFISDNDADCTVNDFSIVYKINRANRGVN